MSQKTDNFELSPEITEGVNVKGTDFRPWSMSTQALNAFLCWFSPLQNEEQWGSDVLRRNNCKTWLRALCCCALRQQMYALRSVTCLNYTALRQYTLSTFQRGTVKSHFVRIPNFRNLKRPIKNGHIYIKILNFVAEMFSAKFANESDFVLVHNSVLRRATQWSLSSLQPVTAILLLSHIFTNYSHDGCSRYLWIVRTLILHCVAF